MARDVAPCHSDCYQGDHQSHRRRNLSHFSGTKCLDLIKLNQTVCHEWRPGYVTARRFLPANGHPFTAEIHRVTLGIEFGVRGLGFGIQCHVHILQHAMEGLGTTPQHSVSVNNNMPEIA